MGRLCFFVILFFLFRTSALAQTAFGFSLPKGKSKVEIPIEIYNNLVVVPVLLNQQIPLKFIVDTGVRTAVLTERSFSDILHLKYSRKYTLRGAGGEKFFNAYVAPSVMLDLPGVHGEGCALFVLDEDYLELRSLLGEEVHGILGYELFSRFVVTLDYARKVMTLTLPQKFKPKKSHQTFPMTVEDTKPYFIVPVQLNDSTFLSGKFLIDTGASHGLLLDPESSEKIKVPPKYITGNLGRGLGGVITGKFGRINMLKIGKYNMPDLIASFPDTKSYVDTLKTGKITFRNGSIGGDLLSRFVVTFDFSKERIYLKKNASFGKKQQCNLSGLIVAARGPKLRDFEITEVRRGSSAEKAGICAGDELLSVNSWDTQQLTLNDVNSLLTQRVGKRISLKLKRANVQVVKVFTLELGI